MAKLEIEGDEALYYKEGKTPVPSASSLLSSNSKWLNSAVLLDLEAPGRHPEGSLGAILGDFYRETGFNQVLAFGSLRPENDYQRYTKRRALLHGVEHIVTGFGTDPAGELGLICVDLTLNSAYDSPELASVLSFNPAYLSTTWMTRTSLQYPATMKRFLEPIRVGFDMASRMARPLYLENRERFFDDPLEDVRRALGIQPTDPSAWAWTEEGWRG